MAFRSAAVTTSANGAACTLPASIAVGDYLVAAAICDFTSITIPTPPTGWTLRSGPTSINGDGQTIWLYDRIADGNESSQRTFTFSGGGDHVIAMAAFSGRNTSTPRTFLSATTPNTGVNGSPVSVGLTGGTAASGDDICWIGMLDTYDGDSSWAFAPPSTYTERTDTSFNWSSLSIASKDNVSSGATGTITGTATSSGDSASWSGFVIGIAAAAGGASTLTCAQASFTLSGQAMVPRHGLTVVLALGSFAETGQAMVPRHGYKVTLAVGTFAETGQAAAFSRSRPPLAGGQATFTLSGQAATLTGPSADNTLTADQASFALTGQAAALRAAHTLAAAQGTFAVTGQAAALTYARKLPEAVASFSLVGNAVVLTRSRPPLVATQASFALSGQAATLRRMCFLTAGQGAFAISAAQVGLTYSGGAAPSTANLTAWHGFLGPSMLQ